MMITALLVAAMLSPRPDFAEAALGKFVDNGEMAGFVSIFKGPGGDEVCCRGWADRENRVPMRTDTLFMICSQTKGVTGVAIAKLVEDGKLKLDDPVSKYLPEFAELWIDGGETNGVRTLRRAKNVLTVRHVMSHTGGFPFETRLKDALGGWNTASVRTTAAAAAAYPLKFEPGTDYSYSNTGIDIGAAVIEVVTGGRYEDYLREQVFKPLGMCDTTFRPTDEQLRRLAKCYRIKSGARAELVPDFEQMPAPYVGSDRYPSAGAGLFSTPSDMLKFYRMIVNGGVGDNGARVLKPETVDGILASKQTPEAVEKPYSLGLWVDHAWFGHGGALMTDGKMNREKRAVMVLMVQQTGDWEHPCRTTWRAAGERYFNENIDHTKGDRFRGKTGD